MMTQVQQATGYTPLMLKLFRTKARHYPAVFGALRRRLAYEETRRPLRRERSVELSVSPPSVPAAPAAPAAAPVVAAAPAPASAQQPKATTGKATTQAPKGQQPKGQGQQSKGSPKGQGQGQGQGKAQPQGNGLHEANLLVQKYIATG